MKACIIAILLAIMSCVPVPMISGVSKPESNCITGVDMLAEIRCIQDFQDVHIDTATQACYERAHTTVKTTAGIVMQWPTSIYRVKILSGGTR